MSLLRRTALALALATAVHVLPQAALAETLAGAMAKAYENNPDLNAARAALRAIDENVTIAKAGMRPHVTGVAEVEGTRTNLDVRPAANIFGQRAGRQTDYVASSYGITISQQVFDGFQTLNRVRAAEANVLANRESLRAQEISILLAAVESYSNIARDQQIVSIRKKNIAFLQEQLSAANARLNVGEGTRTDVSLAEAELASAKALLTAAVSSLKQSEAAYVQIVGEMPKGIKQPSPAKKAMPNSLDNAVATGMRENPNILAAMRSVDAAGFSVKEAEGAMLPGVSLQGSVYKSVNTEDGPSDSLQGTVSARLTVPIYQGGAEYGQIRRAKERFGESQLLVDSARMEVQRTIATAHAQYEAAKASIAAIRVQIDAANQALSGVIEERNVGQRTTLDVLNAQQNVLDAQEDLAAVQRNAVVASYSLLAATGSLTVRSQGLEVAEYRAEVHYEAVKDKWFGLRTVDGR
ncbi:TolC family outer membrane protein [Shinella yambaruensis]|uniref:Transporter n=1 Tax=Shinella yambaruensis TaxID=415996 RepID=A0ABQ5ZEV0_9HYPH|nr:TolC family outer membrane protein [Shinella yambaruensis]MCJ8024116.1 TolC family outer membrane protein [Shinella yambaruensis]MCU7978735.1 TolC family outer membrane protein [Shinella yambaruensis]GLR49413.1 transporter [Shinella yambaruensis]